MIEHELKRIADALEKLVDRGGNSPTVPPAEAPIPEAPIGDTFVPEETPAVIMAIAAVTNTTTLRDFVQKCLTAAEKAKKASELVAFVRDVVCKKFSPKEPKLLKIPEGKVPEAAKMVYDWAVKNDVSIE